jgi:TrmH family RNA methyltransferase
MEITHEAESLPQIILLILFILSKNVFPVFVTPEHIQSRQNPRVQNLAKLNDRAHREALGRFLVEGHREIERALGRAGTIEEIYFCPEHFRAGQGEALLEKAAMAGVPLCRLAPAAFEKASLREGPDGLLAVARAWNVALEDLALTATPLVLVVERVEKPGNLGALLRSADAAGVDAVIVCDPATDLFNPRVVRNSQGTLFSLPVAVAEARAAREFLRGKKVKVVATTPDTEKTYWDVDLRGPAAVAVGGEKDGLTAFWLEAADEKARIPMRGRADSLNVAAAATLVLYEAARQRRK